MGYFANSTEGCMYEEKYCVRCLHEENCAVLKAHQIHNYDECNNTDSILHLLIPRDEKGFNKKCLMFVEK